MVVVVDWILFILLQTVDGYGLFEVFWLFILDLLLGMMILVVIGIGFLIYVYLMVYMDYESRVAYAWYFCYFNLFCFFMLTLVLGSNFLVMFVGWEGVGLCFYLLIGFWYHKKSVSDVGKKVFIVNWVGDWGFFFGIFLVFFIFGIFDFCVVVELTVEMFVETTVVGFGVILLICFFLFIGVIGKSA